MVSPLQTWQHSEPKRLWWVLGGLSALVHVGVLGLSLPYLLDLMVAGGAGSGAIAPPIELVLVDPNEPATPSAASQSVPAEPTAADEPAETTTSSEEQTAPESDSPSAEQARGDRRASDQTAEEPDSPETSASPLSDSEADSANGGGASASTTDGEASGSSEQPSQDQATSDRGGEAQAPSADGSEPNAPNGESSELPAIAGGQQLESPVDSAGTDSDQAVALSIASYRQPPTEFRRDNAATSPVPISGAGSAAVTLRPTEQNCPRVGLPQPPTTYRVTILENGTMEEANLWSAGENRAPSESEEAIACLLVSAGFAFEPARYADGERPPRNNDLLLTIEISESR